MMDIVIAWVLFAGALVGALVWAVYYDRARRDRTVVAGWDDPTDFCMVLGCDKFWQTQIHGWRTCEAHLDNRLYSEPVE